MGVHEQVVLTEEEPKVGKVKKTPPPTLAEIRRSIPKHCFEHSIPHALFLVVRDGAIMATIFLLATRILRTPGISEDPLTVFDPHYYYYY